MESLPETPIIDVPYFDENRFVSPWNFIEDVHPKTTNRKVYIHDVTLRDGEQTPGVVWRLDERVRIAQALDELGVARIEVGIPVVPEVNAAIKELARMNLQAKIVPFARAMKDDIDAAVDAGAEEIVVEHCLNPYINTYVYDLTKQELIERLLRWVSYAKEQGLRTTFMGWDVTRTSFDFVWEIYAKVMQDAKPDALVITDSFGVATPNAIYMAVRKFKEAYPDTPLELHIHNEFGLAMGSVIAGVTAGLDGVHTSVNGLGSRTGNVPTEEVAASLQILLGIDTGVDLGKIGGVSRLVQQISKVPVSPNKPIVGSRVFTEGSGVVTQIVLEFEKLGCRTGMTPYTGELVGRSPYEIVLGPGIGKHTVDFFLDQAGISAKTAEEKGRILEAVRSEARVRKGLLEIEDLKDIVQRVLGSS
jgi:methanogen homocitrate synthase